MKNCEKYKTEYERIKAYGKYCGNNDKCGTTSQDKCIKCFAHWLELEAEVEKPLPCPFCHKEVVVGFNENIHKEGYRQVWCSDTERCGYECVMKKTESEAIAAHNSVCRAVKAAKEGEVK